jgi:Flp pilus assembly protein TadG
VSTIISPPISSRKGATPLLRRLLQSVRGEQGSATVEMALTSVILFLLLIGIIEISLALYSHACVSEAAREAARYAMVRGSTSCINTPSLTNCNATNAQIQTYVQGRKYPGLTSSNIGVTTTWLSASTSQPTTWSSCSPGPCSNAPGNVVQVVVTYPFHLSIPFWNSTTINTSSTSRMVVAQ